MKSVLVLMSTYNGSLFVEKQIESIFNQKDVNVSILVRDDGSSDQTVEILTKCKAVYNNIEIISSYNVGVKHSFLILMKEAQKFHQYDYFAFSDQDDLWLPDKLSRALSMMELTNSSFYYSSCKVVNENLITIEENHVLPEMPSIGKAMVCNSILGCTVVFNRSLLKIANCCMPDINKIMMHDSWLYKIALATGFKVIYDKTPHILYRQHRNNTVGARKSFVKKSTGRLKSFKRGNIRYCEIYEIYTNCVNYLTKDAVKQLEPIIGYQNKSLKERIIISLDNNYRTNFLVSDIIFVVSILFKRF